jgi:hypothetical protein
MDPKSRGSQVYLPGTTDRISQLAWVSLADGGDNAILGYNSGLRLTSSYTNNVLLGTNVARSARSVATTVLVGAAAGRGTDRITDTVGLGYNCLSQATDVGTSVIVGASAGTRLRRTTECVAVGYRSMQYVRDGSSTVAVGSEAARSFQGQYNTIVGAQCAQNVTAQYSTVVGSRNMNRRSGARVELLNSVVLGENIRFDNPTTITTLRSNNAYSIRAYGNSFYDPLHIFADPFVALGANGRILYYIEESREGVVLKSDQRLLRVFESLRLDGTGSYFTSWDVKQIDDQRNLVGTPPYQCIVTTSSANTTHIEANVSVLVDGQPVASKIYKVSNLLESYANVLPYMDVSFQMANANVHVNAVMYQDGVSFPSTENESVITAQSATDNGTGFFLENVQTNLPEAGINYLEIASSFANAAVYSILQHAKNADTTFLFAFVQTVDEHQSSTGAEDDLASPGVLDIVLVDSTASSPRTGNVSVVYSPGPNTANISTSAAFCLTDTLQTPGTIGMRVLEEYRLECGVDTVAANAVTISLYNETTGQLLFDTTDTRTYGPYIWSATGTNTSSIPIDISSIRATADDVWMFLDFFWDVDAPQLGISMRLRARGYSTTGYLAGDAPLISHEYYFNTVDRNPTLNSVIYGRSDVEFFASSTAGTWRLRDVVISATQYRVTPVFSDCVFVGSNFTVANPDDRSNIFLLSLGPSNTLMRGTANTLEVFAPTSFKGPITVGDSPSNNYVAFRGTSGDGFTEMVPKTYVGERVYQEGTQKSELLLFKGDDAPGTTLGPDRVRVLSGQFRVDIPATANTGIYQYPGTTFDTVGQVNVHPVFVTDTVNGTQLYVAQTAPTLVGNNMLGFALSSNNTQLTLYVKGGDGVTRSAALALA